MKEEVAKKYELAGVTPGVYSVSGYGTVDFKTMTLAQADALHARGFPFLKKKAEDPKPGK